MVGIIGHCYEDSSGPVMEFVTLHHHVQFQMSLARLNK